MPPPPAVWPKWLPQWEAGEALLEAVWAHCPSIGEEALQQLADPRPCPTSVEEANLVNTIGNGFFICGAGCVYNPLPSWSGEETPKHWVWKQRRECWAEATSGNPCSFSPAQEAQWDGTVTAYWVAGALLDRLAAAPDTTSGYDPEYALLRDWFYEELATPGPGRNLTALGAAVVEAAASEATREVLLGLRRKDPLRKWQASLGASRAEDCDQAVQDGLTPQVVDCLCNGTEPLIYCRAWEALERGTRVGSLVLTALVE